MAPLTEQRDGPRTLHRRVVRVMRDVRPRGAWWWVGCSCSWYSGAPHRGDRASAMAMFEREHGAAQRRSALARMMTTQPRGAR